jgi:hypothetical protein
MMAKTDPELVHLVWQVIEKITFDDSGSAGRGGNGGLISRDTIHAVDKLRNKMSSLNEDNPND